MTLNSEFVLNAPISRAWETLGDLARFVPLVPYVRVIGSTSDEVFGTMQLPHCASEFRGLAQILERDSTAHILRFEVRTMEMPQPDEPLATIGLVLSSRSNAIHVGVTAELPTLEDAVAPWWGDVLEKFGMSVDTELNRRKWPPGNYRLGPRRDLLEASGLVKLAATGVAKFFLSALSLATGRPSQPPDLYGTPPTRSQDPLGPRVDEP